MNFLRDVKSELTQFRGRLLAFSGLVLFAFSLLFARLVYLQVLMHEDLLAKAEKNRLGFIPSPPSRGLIYDRNGVALTQNIPSYSLEISVGRDSNYKDTIAQLAKVVSITSRDIKRFEKLRDESAKLGYAPIRYHLSDEEVARFAAQSYRFPNVELKARLLRYYPYGELASHVIGYIGRINQKEKTQLIETGQAENYLGTDYIGKVGIEKTYEDLLHGTTGLEQVETTASGRIVRKLASSPSTPGQSLYLSIDIKLQKMVEDLFGSRRGSLVAIDPNNGEVLALVSKPTFDPNIFLDGIDSATWISLNESLQKPLLNRALRGTYPPGSTYKPFMALAALETGARLPSTVIYDPGYYQFGNHRFRGHAVGSVNMERSIIQSSNVYYYSLANEMGVEAIYNFMQPLGFGQKIGIDIEGETRGILPNQEWKRQRFKKANQQKWLAGETISLGIGQGYNSFTPLQLASATATLANGGTRYQPRVLKATKDAITQKMSPVNAQTEPTHLGFKPEHIALIAKAMAGVAKSGTSAGVFKGAEYISAGKTGTAQAVTIGQKERYNAARLSEFQRDHSLYVAFAPVDKPKIALAVIVENAGFGAAHAAPIARRVFDYWLLGKYPSDADISASKLGRASAPLGSRPAQEVNLTPTATNPTSEEAEASPNIR